MNWTELPGLSLLLRIFAEPAWLVAWVVWLMVVNTASLGFLQHVEGRRTAIAWGVNLVLMSALFELNGFNRLLGLSHVLVWTPLLVWLVRRWRQAPPSGSLRTWLAALIASDAVSLVVDYVDVVRYVAGDRT